MRTSDIADAVTEFGIAVLPSSAVIERELAEAKAAMHRLALGPIPPST